MKKKTIITLAIFFTFVIGVLIGSTASPRNETQKSLFECQTANEQYKVWSDQVTKNFHEMCDFYHAKCSDLPFPQTK